MVLDHFYNYKVVCFMEEQILRCKVGHLLVISALFMLLLFAFLIGGGWIASVLVSDINCFIPIVHIKLLCLLSSDQ